jgi:diadenosine tetraphosphate (Ap4A) HIT family hydrolase
MFTLTKSEFNNDNININININNHSNNTMSADHNSDHIAVDTREEDAVDDTAATTFTRKRYNSNSSSSLEIKIITWN